MSNLKANKKNIAISTPTISLLEKECTYLADMAKEVNALIKDKSKQITVDQLIEQATHGLFKLYVSVRLSSFPLEDGVYKNNLALSTQECSELRHRNKITIKEHFPLGSITFDRSAEITRDNLYVLKPDKDAYIQKIKEEYQEQSKLESNNSDAPFPFLIEQHKHFAPELKIAVEAWLDVFTDEKVKHNKGVEVLLTDWLKKHNHILTPAQIKRIATVITPENRKVGGAKKI
jgi:hypothetical protein